MTKKNRILKLLEKSIKKLGLNFIQLFAMFICFFGHASSAEYYPFGTDSTGQPLRYEVPYYIKAQGIDEYLFLSKHDGKKEGVSLLECRKECQERSQFVLRRGLYPNERAVRLFNRQSPHF
jgi:hypothetical protein